MNKTYQPAIARIISVIRSSADYSWIKKKILLMSSSDGNFKVSKTTRRPVFAKLKMPT